MSAGVFAFDSDATGNYELYTMAKGQAAIRLTTDPRFDSWSPRLSPDRRTLLFYRTPAGVHDSDYQQTSLWRIGTDGSDLRELRPVGTDGWELQGHAEWSPDGQRLVMFGGIQMNPQLFVTDAAGQHPVQVTDRPGVNLDPAFTADGSGVYFVGCPQAECYEADYEIYRQDLATGQAARLTFDRLRDHDPYASPQGDRVAWLTRFATDGIGVWDVRVAATDGTGARRLVGDDGVTSRAQWAADGQSVLVHRIPPTGGRWDVYEVTCDGSKVTVLTGGHPGSSEYPTW